MRSGRRRRQWGEWRRWDGLGVSGLGLFGFGLLGLLALAIGSGARGA